MIIPTLGCPSNCAYCWSSEEDSELMTIETIEEVVKWLENFRDDTVTVTFHGGEPLLCLLYTSIVWISPNFEVIILFLMYILGFLS